VGPTIQKSQSGCGPSASNSIPKRMPRRHGDANTDSKRESASEVEIPPSSLALRVGVSGCVGALSR
jgi:hypothetical protein